MIPGKTIPLIWVFAVTLVVLTSSGCGVDPEVYRREVALRQAAENHAAAAESRARMAEERAKEAERRLVFADQRWFYVALAAAAFVAVEGFAIAYLRGQAAKESDIRPIVMELLRAEHRRAALPPPERQRPRKAKQGTSTSNRRLPWTT